MIEFINLVATLGLAYCFYVLAKPAVTSDIAEHFRWIYPAIAGLSIIVAKIVASMIEIGAHNIRSMYTGSSIGEITVFAVFLYIAFQFLRPNLRFLHSDRS